MRYCYEKKRQCHERALANDYFLDWHEYENYCKSMTKLSDLSNLLQFIEANVFQTALLSSTSLDNL